MDLEKGASESTENLIPSYAEQKAAEKGASESTKNQLPSYAEQKAALAATLNDPYSRHQYRSHLYMHQAPLNVSTSTRGSRIFQAVILTILALGISAGFCVLFVRMTQLQRQVYELESLISVSAIKKSQAHGADDDVNLPAQTGSEDEDTTHNTEIDGQDGQNRKRRSAAEGDIHHPVRRTVSVGTTSIQHMSTHAVPLGTGSQRLLSSQWFRWTTTPTNSLTNTVEQLPIRQNTYIVAPHAGYYYIYSQVACNDPSTGHSIGHALWLVPHCGRSTQQKKLMYTLATQTSAGSTLSPLDSTYLGGVFFLQKYDHIGIKPELAEGINRGTFLRTGQTSYFGAFLLSATTPQAVTCSLNI